MGSSGSKAARAAGSSTRQYPSRIATQANPTTNPTTRSAQQPAATPATNSHSPPQAYDTRNEAIDLDARDPRLASRLTELGPVKPFPTYSPSSTVAAAMQASSRTSKTKNIGSSGPPSGLIGNYPSPAANPAVAILAARRRIQEAVDQEKIAAGRPGFEGRQYLDVATVRKVLALRDEQGMNAGDIEKALGLRNGLVQKLGRVGVIEAA